MRSTIIVLFTLLVTPNLQGQTVDNILASFDGEKVTVAYNLESKKEGQRFNVFIYSSHDNSLFLKFFERKQKRANQK
jgi:hypothetical protein